MNLARSDASLYQIAIASEPAPQLLQISPTTFKSTVGLIFNLLIEQKVPATVWLKLPKGDVWQAELQRFHQAAAPHTIYTLQMPSDGASRLAIAPAADREDSQLHILPLPAESLLKREYFLLVASPQFCGLILVHRPHSAQIKAKTSLTAIEEVNEQKHPLLGLCTFDPATLQAVLDGMSRAICLGQPGTQPDPELERLLLTWEHLATSGQCAPSPGLLGHLINQQIQRQEDLWRSSTTHRRQAETALILKQDNEALLNVVRQKNDFVKTLGQELRTPLSSMKTALSLLGSPTIKPLQRQKYLEMLIQECDRQSSLIASVLDLVQIESAEQVSMESLRLSDLVPGIVSTYQPLAQEKGVMLYYTIPEELPPVSCSSQWLRQIVINLLHNSIKFTPSGGQVRVRARRQDQFVRLEFRDTGVGIPPAELSKIFDRFYRVRVSAGEDSGGSGLGLSIVQQLLLRCGGSITVKSKVGEGTAFAALLPVYQP